MKTPSGKGPSARTRRAEIARQLGPRGLQVLIGVWLILSAFLWPHLRLQAMVVWAAGGLTVLIAAASIFVQPLRLLLGLVAIWLIIGTFIQPALIGTLVNNLFCAVAILALSFLPPGNVRLFRRMDRHRTA